MTIFELSMMTFMSTSSCVIYLMCDDIVQVYTCMFCEALIDSALHRTLITTITVQGAPSSLRYAMLVTNITQASCNCV